MYNGSFDLSNESKPIRDIAYDRLKHAIITGELPAGSRIVETTYAEQLHISRTPLREALRKAQQSDGPVLIDCQIDKDERVLPMIPAGGTIDDLVVD